MLRNSNTFSSEKFSPQFQARLRALPAGACIRAILLFRADAVPATGKPPRTRAERQAVAQAVRADAELAMPEIEDVLAHYAGKKLAERPSSLGTLPVETTSEGLQALAALQHVKMILEDQPIAALSARQAAL